MARKATLQTTWSKGELDPDLSERIDLEHYFDSAAAAPNTVFHPQGGFSDRGGLALVSDADVLAAGTRRRLRRDLVPLAITSANLTALNGGTTANLVDQDHSTMFTTNPVTSGLFVVVEIDLGVAQFVDLVDLIAFRAELGGADQAIGVQFWNGSGWVNFVDPLDLAPRKHIRTAARTRRFGTAPGGPGGIRVLARNWRVVCVGASGAVGQISIGGLRLWQESAQLTPIDVIEVARASDATYELVVTGRNIDVFERQRYVASIPLPVSSQQIDQLTYAGGFDTLLVFHEQLETVRIVRQGSAGEWDVGATPYTDVPDLSDQIVFSGDQDEIQRLTIAGLEVNHVVYLVLGDHISTPIVYASPAALAGQLVAALDALPGVAGAGHLVVTVAGTDPLTVEVRFTGSNGNRAWPLLDILTAADIDVATQVVQPGLKATGKLFAADTGWPRCGAFAQQRLVVGGFRAAPKSAMFGRPGSWSYLSTGDPMTADLAFLRTLDTDRVEAITTMFVGRHLQIFTQASEWYCAALTLDATQPTPMVRTTAHGVRRAVPIVFSDGASVFVQATGRTLRDMVWNDAEQSYNAEPLSVLSPQILSDVVDVAHRSARSVTEGNQIFLVNGSGTAGCLTLLRGQNVIAGSPWSTDGLLLAAMCNVLHQVYWVVERAGERYLERWTPDMPLDFATTLLAPAGGIVTGASHLDDRSDVWAIADGEVLGPFTVQGGVFDLGLGATPETVTYGLLPAWRVRTQVLRGKLTQEMPYRPPARIYEVELAVTTTGQLMLATSGGAAAEVPLVRLGDAFADGGPLQDADTGAPGLAMFDRLYTGNVTMQGLTGFSKHPYVELSRTVPAPVHVKSLRLEIVQKGAE